MAPSLPVSCSMRIRKNDPTGILPDNTPAAEVSGSSGLAMAHRGLRQSLHVSCPGFCYLFTSVGGPRTHFSLPSPGSMVDVYIGYPYRLPVQAPTVGFRSRPLSTDIR